MVTPLHGVHVGAIAIKPLVLMWNDETSAKPWHVAELNIAGVVNHDEPHALFVEALQDFAQRWTEIAPEGGNR